MTSLRFNNCPCCGSSLLRHVRQSGVYWFCTSCWQEVPLLTKRSLPRQQTLTSSLHLKQPVSS
ncbi:MAG: hypothetical protein VKL59_22515 [Nostocaceae cyanobacterium]|nr:hypothetical protein [Nostocaceae cyanobacterium]